MTNTLKENDPNLPGHSGFKPMPMEYRPYICTQCGQKDNIQTNHLGPVFHYCKGCSWKPSFGEGRRIPSLGNHMYRQFIYDKDANKLNEQTEHSGDYKYIEFKWMGTTDGFNYPIDVYHRVIYLGILEAKQDGYIVSRVSAPDGNLVRVVEDKKNKFKSKDEAAAILHRLWKMQRTTSI